MQQSLSKEFLMPQCSQGVFQLLLTVGEQYDIRVCGAYAMDSLRMETGHPYWGQELDTDSTPWEARRGSTVDMKKVQLVN